MTEINNLPPSQEERKQLLILELEGLKFRKAVLSIYNGCTIYGCDGECQSILMANPMADIIKSLKHAREDLVKDERKPVERRDYKPGYLDAREASLLQRIVDERNIHVANPYLKDYHRITTELRDIGYSLNYSTMSKERRTALLAKRENTSRLKYYNIL